MTCASPPHGTSPLLRREHNSLSGTIPDSWLPPNITTFLARLNRLSLPADGRLQLPSSLISLDLSGNPLNGSIPSSLTNLTSLAYLHLGSCGLRGKLPAAPLPRPLTTLWLEGNNFTGSVPWAAWDLPDSLESLILAGNRLTGPLPPTLPASLEDVDLHDNAFSGSLLQLMGSLPTNLTYTLDLNSNHLTGPLPQVLTLPPGKPDAEGGALAESGVLIDLSNNSLSGPLPAIPNCGRDGNGRHPASLNFSSNQLSGSLPSDSSLLACNWVDLSLNRLAGGQEG